MFRKSIISLSVISSVIIPLASTGVAFACHPQGTIVKTVQNITTNSKVSDANSVSTAVTAKPGDVLRYTITIKNGAGSDAKGSNDMINTVMTDTLPAGVALVGSSASSTITENFGTVASGKSVTKSYDVKVTSTTDNAVLTNKACFVGDSKTTKSAQKGCDIADVVVDVLVVTPTPTPTPKPTPVVPASTTVQTPTVLPNTGVGSNIVVLASVTGIFGYVASRIYMRKFGQ